MAASLDALSRTLEQTHTEIAQVRSEVVGALRTFYASPSALSEEEAVAIAAKWTARRQSPVSNSGGEAATSDLQEKMRRLNAALLDSVDRLQLGDSAELAPQAKLIVSFTQREHLKQQMHQSKTMLALIERLTQIDTLLGELDAAIDQQRFVAAAEGLATAESLLVELTDANGSSHNEDKSIVRLIRLQLLDKKSRLLSQLSRFFSCSVLWQDGAVKVAKEGGSESLEKRREFWKACEVLDILTLRLKEVAKAITQYLVKPLLQLPHGVVKLVREDSGVKLTLVRQHEQPETATTASEVAQVQDKCANVVNVLLFVHSELFAGNSELMHRLGDLMWKIPGNLEAQLMNLLQDKIPQDATSLNSYRSVLVTAVNDLENKLVAVGFSACSNSQLREFVNQLNQLHSKKRRQGILSQGRELMRQGYHDSVKLPVATEKSGLNAPISAEKKGASGKDEDPVFDSEDVASGCFQTPDYRVTVCAHGLVELTHQTLIEGCTSGVASAKLLFQTSRDLLFLFRTIVPTLHEDDIANDPRTCMLYHNDCIYIAHHMLVIGHLYKQRLPPPLNQTATMSDMVPSFRDAGERALNSYASALIDEIITGAKALPALKSVDSEQGMNRVEQFIKSALNKLEGISSSWREGLSVAVYNKIMARMLEPLVKNFVDGVLAETKLSESVRKHLHHLLSLLLECETLFDSPAQAVKHVSSIGRLTQLTTMLIDPLATVRGQFNGGNLAAFSSQELTVLVKSLFRDSPEKKAFLQELLSTG